MSAHFHSYLCGRKAAEWLIYMKIMLMILLTISLLLPGCVADLSQNNTDLLSTEPSQTEATGSPKTAVRHQSGFVSQPNWNTYSDTSITVITSMEQVDVLKALNNEKSALNTPENNAAYNYLSKYSAASFADGNLVIIAIEVTYQGQPISCSTKSVVANENVVEIALVRTIPFALEEIEGRWVMFVELYDFNYSGQEIQVDVVDEHLDGPLPE